MILDIYLILLSTDGPPEKLIYPRFQLIHYEKFRTNRINIHCWSDSPVQWYFKNKPLDQDNRASFMVDGEKYLLRVKVLSSKVDRSGFYYCHGSQNGKLFNAKAEVIMACKLLTN